ncbi:MAG: hypothetical protein ACRD72_21880 [Candidatus Angelobacter sp.]
MIDVLKQAMERAAQQSDEEQAAIAQAIMEMLDADTTWDALLNDPRTPEVLDKLWAEAMDEVKQGNAEEITGDGFNS